MRINTNVSSITAQEAAVNTGKNIKSSLEKLSTGLRINKASDDASGLAIADKLRTQATSIDQGVSNGNSAVTLLQIADKSMAEQSNILDTIKSKLIQANTDTTSADGREAIRKDVAKLLEQLDNIAEQTNYNGNVLLQNAADDQTKSEALSFQIGESNADIITNTAIQSNTTGLGSEVVYSAANENNTIVSGESKTLSSSGSISLTATNTGGENTAEAVSLSGDVDSVSLKSGMVVSGMDATTQAALSAHLTAESVAHTQSGNTFTLNADTNIDLSAIDDVAATITTPAESSSNFDYKAGDLITASTVNDGSALATALSDPAKFSDNNDGTYTALANAGTPVTLETGESVDYSRAQDATNLDLSSGDVLTLTNAVVENSELDLALQAAVTAGDLTITSGNAGEAGTVYTASASVSSVGIAQGEEVSLDSPTNLTSAIGDMFTLGANVVASSALDTALSDGTKFELISGGAGTTGAVYKALTAETIALSSGENVSKAQAKDVDIGAASVPAGSTVTLNAAVVAGSDLDNQLNAASGKFTYDAGASGGNAAGTAGAVYNVNDDYTTDTLKIVATEAITVQPAESVNLPTAQFTGDATVVDTAITLNGGAADFDEANGTVIADGGTNGDAPLVAATPQDLVFTVSSAAGGGTFVAQAGDTINLGTSTDPDNSLSQQIKEDNSANWIDNGDNTYTAIATDTLTLNAAGDTADITRSVGSSAPATPHTGDAATTVERSATSTTGASDAANVAPSATVSVDVTTSSTLNVLNNGGANDTLTISGSEEISNGGTQLSALAAVSSGNMTAELASSFQAVVDDAITDLNSYRGDIGSTQNQVESAVRNLMTQSTNVKAAESIIRDVDYAAESANFNKQNIISQAGSYAISQANSVQQNVLRLLQ